MNPRNKIIEKAFNLGRKFHNGDYDELFKESNKINIAIKNAVDNLTELQSTYVQGEDVFIAEYIKLISDHFKDIPKTEDGKDLRKKLQNILELVRTLQKNPYKKAA